MSISQKLPIRLFAFLVACVLPSAFTPNATAAFHPGVELAPELNALYLVMRIPNRGGQWIYLPFDENLEIHKGFDATVRSAPVITSEGVSSDYTETEIGFSLDLTDFTREGDTLRFNMVAESRQIIGWQTYAAGCWPVFQTKTFRTTSDSGPRTVQSGEWNCLIPGEESDPGVPIMCIGPFILFTPD